MPCYNKWQRICWDRFRLIRYYRQRLKASHNMRTQSEHTTLHFKRSVILPLFTAFDVNSVCLCKYIFFFWFHTGCWCCVFLRNLLLLHSARTIYYREWMFVCSVPYKHFFPSPCYCSFNADLFFICVVLVSLRWKSMAHPMVMLLHVCLNQSISLSINVSFSV